LLVCYFLKNSNTWFKGFLYILLIPEAGYPIAITLLEMYARSRLNSSVKYLILF
jgi:hypothetical protein